MIVVVQSHEQQAKVGQKSDVDNILTKIWQAILSLRESADTDFAFVQNFVKFGLYLKKWYDKQQASWEFQILRFV